MDTEDHADNISDDNIRLTNIKVNRCKARQIMNRIQLVLLLLILSSCKVDTIDIIDDPSDIPDEITATISALELIKPNEIIVTIFHNRSTEIPSFEPAKKQFYLLTNERFLRYFGEKKVQEIKFNNCLDIEIDSTTVVSDYITYHMSAKSTYQMIYDVNGQLTLLPDFKEVHYGGKIAYQTDFQSLNSLVIKTWRNHHNYDSLRSIYKKFYDKNGKRID